jgi:TP53 regulating kinase-like protein
LENGSGGDTLEELIARGAEAELWLRNWNRLKVIFKTRRPKKYRHPELDKQLRSSRTGREADILHKAKIIGVPTPLIYMLDLEKATIVMEFIDGVKVRDLVNDLDDESRFELFTRIGEYSGLLHKGGIIHGDLTTSNIIKQGKRIVFIDFGLSEISFELEKRGVDLNLMNRMLTSTHYKYQEELLHAFMEGYRSRMGVEADEAIERMEEVAMRGRYIEKE